MSLLRLLTAGRSLETIKSDASCYRVANTGFLPKFASKQNPFRVTSRPDNNRQAFGPTAVVNPVTVKATAQAPQTPLPGGSAATGTAPKAAVEPATGGLGWLYRAVLKLRPRFRRSGKAVGAPARARLIKGPVQGELLLASVKVVRNDLSDSDLEVVPARGSVPAARNALTARPVLGAARIADAAETVAKQSPA